MGVPDKQAVIESLGRTYSMLEQLGELGSAEINSMTLGRLRLELIKRDVVVVEARFQVDNLIAALQ